MTQLFLTFLRLGLSSFGGPVAHIAYFYEEFVQRKQWFSDRQFKQWISLCQFLPGPASSQLGIIVGYMRGGYLGAFWAWFAFTIPSALFLLSFALGLLHNTFIPSGIFYSLKILAIAVIAHALIGMIRPMAHSKKTWLIIVLSLIINWSLPILWIQLLWILCCASLGFFLFKETNHPKTESASFIPQNNIPQRLLSIFFLLLVGLPFIAHHVPTTTIQLADSFYRAGALVFGGGHTVLPWLQTETQHLISHHDFLIGYGLTQAVPGPLFTFAAFLGGLMDGVWGGMIALIFIFLPGAILVLGVLPLWSHLQQYPSLSQALQAVNACVIGILMSTFIQSLASDLTNIPAMLLALFGFICLQWLKLNASKVVLLFLLIGYFL